MSDLVKFEVGKTYYTRSVCDSDCIFSETIKSRTEKTITTENGKRFKVKPFMGVETFFPNGNYSMCAIIGADRELV